LRINKNKGEENDDTKLEEKVNETKLNKEFPLVRTARASEA
jgi:hypothetical protein